MARFLGRVLLSWAFLALFGAIGGVLAFGFLVGRPKVGVITVPFTILFTDSVREISVHLQYARERPDIQAVVLKMTSPGGGVSASEEFFLQMYELRQKKPLVVAVDSFALSGGYMGLMGANYIFVKPSSLVGNVGATLFLPPRGLGRPTEQFIPTGPFKAEGASFRMYVNLLEQVKEAFADIVWSQRGDRLFPGVSRTEAYQRFREEVLTGRLYIGSEGVRIGVADEVGTDADAIRKAARLARIRFYSLVDVNREVERLKTAGLGLYSGPTAKPYKSVREFLATPEFPYIYYLYVEPR